MHILLIHQAFATLNEPGGTRHHELARFLIQRGHRVTVIASPVSYLTGSRTEPAQRSDSSRQDAETGLTIVRTYTYPAWHRSFVHRVFSFLSFMFSSFIAGLRVPDVDLVWGTSPPIFQGGTAWALARLKGARFLFEVRDLWPAFAIQVGVLRNRVLIRAAEWFERFLYRHADQIMINSPGFRQHIQNKGIRQVALIPNGTDASMFDPSSSGLEFRRSHNLEGKFIALYAGAHGMSNDLETLLQAAARLRQPSNIAIVLLGDGKEKPALMQQAQEMKLTNVHFLPPVPKTAMPEALAAADACIAILKPIPLYETVYPNKVFDYMAAGRPVILAIDGVIRQVIELGQAGVPVPPGDAGALANAIQSLADAPEKSRTLGENGRMHILHHFDRVVIAGQLEQLLLSTLKKE